MKVYYKWVLALSVIILGLLVFQRTQESAQQKQAEATVANSDMKTVTDHAGNTINIPKDPKRIASLHYPITIMLYEIYEMKAPIIGASTRIKKPENIRYIRSGYELFGLDFSQTGWANYGSFGKDLEQVKVSKPDLIIGGLYHQKFYEQLSKIAPTILIDYKYQHYADLAKWIGQNDSFNDKEKAYQEKLKAIKAKFQEDISKKQLPILQV